MEQSSEGPHSPSPHTQLQGGDPPVQLQTPALQSAMTCLRQAPLACPLIPLAATSSLQAFRPHREEAVATGDTMAAPSASIAKPARTLRATMADLLRLVRPLACQLTTPLTSAGYTRRRQRELAQIARFPVERISGAASLRIARRRAGLSVEAFADRLRIYPAALLCWEAGRKPVPPWVLGRLQRHFTGPATPPVAP